MGRARDLANILSSSSSVALDSELGLSLITPTSITATGGSGSISSSGGVSFTSASAISLNNCLSSTYDNYRFVIQYITSNAGPDIYMRWRENTTDVSASNYYNAGFRARFDNTTSSVGAINGGNVLIPATGNQTYRSFFTCDITKIGSTIGEYSSLSYEVQNAQVRMSGGYAAGMTNFNGFSIYPSAGTFTGEIRLYGYRN